MEKGNRRVKRFVLLCGIIILFIILGLKTRLGFAKIILQYSDHTPPVTPPARAAVYWQQLITQKTKGEVEFKNTFGGGLLGEAEIFRGVESGIADIAWYPVNPKDGFRLSTISLLPFLDWPSRRGALQIYEKLLSEFPPMKSEWDSVKILSISFMLPTHFHMVNPKKVLKFPSDIRGQKIITTGEHTEIIKALKAIPVEVPIGDWYTALERGVAQGALNHFGVAYTFGFLPLLKSHTVFGEGGINITPVFMIMNKSKWEKLPPEIKKVFDAPEIKYAWTNKMWELEETETLQKALDFCKEKQHTFVYLNSKEIKMWREAVKDIINQWIEENEKQKLPAKKLYERLLQLIEEQHRK